MKRKNLFLKTICLTVAALVLTSFMSVLNNAGSKVSAEDETCKTMLGVNLEGLADYMSGDMFVDAMKVSRNWGSPSAPWNDDSQKNLKRDDGGWPLEDAGIVVLTSSQKEDNSYRNISGTYKLSFEGTAIVKPVAFQFTVSNQKTSGGVTTADITVPAGQTSIMMSFTNTANPNSATGKGVRNVRMIKPGYQQDEYGNYPTFTREFLQAIEPFSTLRFMDFLATNGQDSGSFVDGEGKTQYFSSETKEWSNRKLPTDASQAANIKGYNGGAFEYIVELANLTGKDIWINIPVNASIDFMTRTAQLLKDTLDSNINIYVEYSNEVWNWQFSQAQSNVYYANKDSALYSVYKDSSYVMRYAERSAQIANAFQSVFGTDAMNSKVRCVLAWQQNDGGTFDSMMNFLKTKQSTYGDPKGLFYTFSVAPYFQEPDSSQCTDIEVIQNKMIANSDASRTYKLRLVTIAGKWDMKGGVMAYEGGPHYVGSGTVNLEIRKEAHRDSNMKDIVIRDIKNNWFELGGKGFMYFSLSGAYGQYGCWGSVESFDNFNTPKYQALTELSNMSLSSLNIFREPGGLITNGGFENDLSGWNNANNTQGVYGITTETAHSGTKALKLSGKGSSNGFIQNNWVIAEDTDYVLSFYTKGADSRVSVCNGKTGWDNGYVSQTGVNNDWTLKTISFNSGTDSNFFLLLQDRFSGVTYYDDFKLVKSGEEIPTVTPTPALTTPPGTGTPATPTSIVTPTPTQTTGGTEGLSPTPTETPTSPVTPTPTDVQTTPGVTKTPVPSVKPIKQVYINVSNVSVAKAKGTFKVSVKQAKVYKKTSDKKSKYTYKKGKTLKVVSIKGNWAKVTISRKTYYTRITNLTFTYRQSGTVLKKAKTYTKASSKSKVAGTLNKNKKITVSKRSGSYYYVK